MSIDVRGHGHGRYCLPRHRVPCNSRNEGSIWVSMTWRAMSARPYCVGSPGIGLDFELSIRLWKLGWRVGLFDPGRAVQVDPIKPTLKPPGTKSLRLKMLYTALNFCFQFQLAPLHLGFTHAIGNSKASGTHAGPQKKIRDANEAGGSLTKSTRPTLNRRPCPRVCMSIHREGKSCSNLGSSACSQ